MLITNKIALYATLVLASIGWANALENELSISANEPPQRISPNTSFPSTVVADQFLQPFVPNAVDVYLYLAYIDIYVFTVVELSNEVGTNSRPPTGRIRVDRVIRESGNSDRKYKEGNTLSFTFRPFTHKSEDYLGQETIRKLIHSGADSGAPSFSKTEEWKERLLLAPSKDTAIVVYINHSTVVHAHEFSDYAAQYITENMDNPARSNNVQIPLFLFILVAPVISNIMLRKNKKHQYMFVLQFAAYLIYESGVPTYMNIRVDLVIIIPILFYGFYCLLKTQESAESR